MKLVTNVIMRKLKKTDVVSVIECFDNNFFIESDLGNYTVIKKNNIFKLEPYVGSLTEFLNEYEVARPKGRKKNGYVHDFFPGMNI